MSDDDTFTNRDRSRRDFVRTAGVTLAGLVGITGVSGATTRSQGPSPERAEATVVKRFSPEGDHFRLEKRAISPAFKERFGGPVLTYEPEPVPREAVPEEYTDPDRPFTITYRDDLVVGTLEEQLTAERAEREAATADARSSQYYDGPKYIYESASGAEDEDIYERTAPINVAWGTSIDRNALQLQSYMESKGWEEHWTMPGSGTRYILYNGSAEAQDEHIYKEIHYTRQWHIRAYDVSVDSSTESIQVIGNAHRDPLDHNKIGDEPWQFNDARDEAANDWESWGESSEYVFMGSTRWETHDGNLSVIYSRVPPEQ